MKHPKPPEEHPDLFGITPDSISVKWLENLLRGHGGWMTAKDIILTTRGKAHERTLRDLASQSGQIITGQKGHKHIEHATAEEIAHASNWLISQGKKNDQARHHDSPQRTPEDRLAADGKYEIQNQNTRCIAVSFRQGTHLHGRL